jgi:hypothetical protein
VAAEETRRHAALVTAAKVGVSATVLAWGFRAISDDDFARVVIAQEFVASPRLDPSGTSWLPLPFWLQGAVMAGAGRTLEVARATSFVLGVLSAILVLVAATWLGVRRTGALLGALVACAIPYAAWLGVATVPDAPTASLILLGAAAAGSATEGRRLVGATALLAASLSRYEAWPVAATFAIFAGIDAVRQQRPWFALAAAVACAGPCGWMLHGLLTHHDPVFFLARVAAYRRSLGASSAGIWSVPFALLRCEPELAGITLATVATAWVRRVPMDLARYRRAAILLLGLLVFLVVGDLRDGAATHHGERVLLAIWLAAAVLSGDLLCRIWSTLDTRGRLILVAAACAIVGLGAAWVRPGWARRDSFVDRSLEASIGEQARAAGASSRLLVDSRDYGYLAVIAGFGRPERAAAFDPRDPRQPPRADAFASAGALRRRLQGAGADWLVVTREHAEVARTVGVVRAENPDFLLLQTSP